VDQTCLNDLWNQDAARRNFKEQTFHHLSTAYKAEINMLIHVVIKPSLKKSIHLATYLKAIGKVADKDLSSLRTAVLNLSDWASTKN